jgi:hypothetical protein
MLIVSRPVLALLLLVGILGPCLAAQQADGGWWDDILEERAIVLEDLLQAPDRLRGQTVSFVLQFGRASRVGNPYHTRFEDDWYQNFTGWGDQAPLWRRDAYQNPFTRMFVRRGTEAARALTDAREYSRWRIVGEVADVVRGQPWIEVRAVSRLDRYLTEPCLVALVKGFMLRDLKRWDAAASAFHAADDVLLPEAVRLVALREEAMALHEAGKTSLALVRLDVALTIAPGNEETRALWSRYRTSLGLDPALPVKEDGAQPAGNG